MDQPSQSSGAGTTGEGAGATGTVAAVVTGAARGIGRAIAARLVSRGYAVVVADLDGEAARRAAAQIGAAAGIAQDVRDEAGHHAVAAEACRYGRLAVWVNNAGVADDGMLPEQDPASLTRMIDVNLTGVVWGCRAAVFAMPRGGEIVNVASVSGHGPVPGLAVYAATKAAVVSLSMSLDSELHGRGVRVHALCPDGVDTQLVARMDPQGQGSALVHSGGRLLTTEEVAEAAVGLLGSRRVVRTVPAWRGGMMRLSAMAPGLLMRLEPIARYEGRRRMRRAARHR